MPGVVVLAVDGDQVTALEAFTRRSGPARRPMSQSKLTIMQGSEVRTIVLTPQDRMLTLKKPAGI